ncbi:MAG TPA: hypothetical protein DCS04_04490, partial [Ruminococcaceae bacterium]|nr:hypothetical protein [Oscillospiraceae bacterium]
CVVTEGFYKKIDETYLTPPTSAQTAEATSPAREARGLINFQLLDHNSIINHIWLKINTI